MHEKSINLFLRGGSLFGKFIFLLVFAKSFSNSILGEYGILVTTIVYSLYIVGFDYYTFTTREILATENRDIWVKILKEQLILYLISYIILIPVIVYIVFYFGNFLEKKYILFFVPLLIVEHLSQEFFRILIIFRRTISANVVLFFRLGVWAYIASVFLLLEPNLTDVRFIYVFWFISCLVSVGIGVFALKDFPWRNGIKVDFKNLKKGIGISLFYLMGTIALRGFFSFDRYFLQHFGDIVLVGILSFYSTFSSVIQTLVDTLVISVLYPQMLKSFQDGNNIEYRRIRKKMKRGIIFFSSLGFIFIWIFLFVITEYVVNKMEFRGYFNMVYILSFLSFLVLFHSVYDYDLYIRHYDKYIVLINIFGLFFLLALYFIISFLADKDFLIYGYSVASVLTILVIIFFKSRIIKQRESL